MSQLFKLRSWLTSALTPTDEWLLRRNFDVGKDGLITGAVGKARIVLAIILEL